jgi:type IV pilus modification protein PilV
MYTQQNAHGFTLIETLIAIMVLSIGLLGAAKISLMVISSNTFDSQLTAATILAQQQIEDLQRLGYTHANTAAGTEAYGTITNFASYQRVTTIVANTPATAMLTATVTVWWAQDTHSVTLRTILGE